MGKTPNISENHLPKIVFNKRDMAKVNVAPHKNEITNKLVGSFSYLSIKYMTEKYIGIRMKANMAPYVADMPCPYR